MRSPADAFRDKHVLVTGAASGIGRATALAVADLGAHLHLTDRHADGLEVTAADVRGRGARTPTVRALDIRDFDAVGELAREVHASVPHVDIVMNIAGVSAWGAAERLEHRQWRDMVDINLMGPIHVIEAFLPAMVAAGDGGHLVNVSSAAGLFGLPWHAAYSASKFGVRGISEVLRFELRHHGIRVTLVCPGGVDTPLTDTIEVAGVDTTSARFQRLQHGFRRRAVTPEHAAAAIIAGVTRRRYLVYTSPDIRALHVAQRLTPHVYNGIMRAFNVGMRRTMPVEAAPR